MDASLKLFEIDEAGCVKTWAAATSTKEAERLMLDASGLKEWEDPEEVLTREVPEARAREMSVVDSDSPIAVDGKVTLWALFEQAKTPQLLCSTEY